MSVSKVFLGVASLIGMGGLGLFGAHETTKKTISDELGEKKIPKFEKNGLSWIVWNSLSNKLKNISRQEKDPQTNQFIDFEKTLEKNANNPEKLRDFCEKIIKETYSTIFKKYETLLEDVKSFCTIKIGTVGIGNLLDTSESERGKGKVVFKSHLSSLKESKENLVNSFPELEKVISSSDPKEESDWEKLAEWCDNSYQLSFFDENDLLWKQVEKYCWKTVIR